MCRDVRKLLRKTRGGLVCFRDLLNIDSKKIKYGEGHSIVKLIMAL